MLIGVYGTNEGLENTPDSPPGVLLPAPKGRAAELLAQKHGKKLGIPIIAIVDTNCDPDEVDYVIPGNDDAIRAIKLFTGKIADACLEGRSAAEARGELAPPVEEREFYDTPRYDSTGTLLYFHRNAAIVKNGTYVGNESTIERLNLKTGERVRILTDAADSSLSRDCKLTAFIHLKDGQNVNVWVAHAA